MTVYAGWELAVRIATSSSLLTASSINISGIQRITYRRTEGVELKGECGTRYQHMTEGPIALSGTIERYYTGSETWVYVGGITPISSGALTAFYIGIYPAGYGTGNPKIELNGVKFTSREESQRPGTNIYSEIVTFVGTGSITTGSVP